MTEKSPEQLAAEAEQAKQTKTAEKAAAKAAADAKKAADKEAKAQASAAAKAAKEKEKADKAAAKVASEANKEAGKMPMQNEVRRPKPGGACGKVWELADTMSAAAGSPVAIADLHKAASAAAINDSTIRTQYALWRKFHGITGRVVTSTPAAGGSASAGSDGAQAPA